MRLEKLSVQQIDKKFHAFLETEITLPYAQQPETYPHPEAEPIHALSSYFLKINFNITLPSTPSLPRGLFPSRFPH
jgi:hypothetical protein